MQGNEQLFIPNLQEETILGDDHRNIFSQLNFVMLLSELLADLAMTRGAPIAALMESSDESVDSKEDRASVSPESLRLGLLLRALHALSAGLRLAAHHFRADVLKPTPQVKTVVSAMNCKYKCILAECKRMHLAGVTPTVCDRLLYKHAIKQCQIAAINEILGDPEDCHRRYVTAQVLLHSLTHHLPQEGAMLAKYIEAVQRRINNLCRYTALDSDAMQRRLSYIKNPRKIMEARIEAGLT